MNPLRVTATNYRTFERLDVEIPTGCIAVIGENGAGKSSIINLVDVALFAGRGELPGLLTTGEELLEISLEFEHAGELYRVRRAYSAKGRGKTMLDLEQCNLDPPFGPIEPSDWQPLTRETAEATQDLIEQTLGLSRATFRASSFLAQGDGAAFTEASPRDRKAILAEILGLHVWDALLERARVELRGCESDLLKTEGAIAGLDDLAATKSDVLAEISSTRERRDQTASALGEAEIELEQAQLDLTKAAAARETVRACEAEHQAAVESHARARLAFATAAAAQIQVADKTIELEELAADASQVDELEEQLGGLLAAAASVAETRQRRTDLARHIAERETARDKMVERGLQLHTAAQELLGKADHLDAHIGESALCDRCQQVLGAEAAARASASYRAEAAGHAEESAALDATCSRDLEFIAEQREQLAAIEIPTVEDHAPVEAQLRAARRAAEEHVRLTEQVRQLADVASHKPTLDADLATAQNLVEVKAERLDVAKEAAGDVAAVEAKVSRWRVSVQEGRKLLEARNAELVRAEQQLERVVDAEQKLATHHQATALIRGRVDVLKLAEKAYGRDGIPALIVENAAIPQLELEANRIIGELGGSTADCRIELRTQRELKSSDSLRETLDIVIRTPTGDRPYESFSGGERTRLNLALRIALARLLAHRRGADSRLLAIDEPEFLDEQGVGRLADVLRSLTGDFDRVLLVSHHPTLAASFDQTISVAKDGDRSRVEGSLLEAVA